MDNAGKLTLMGYAPAVIKDIDLQEEGALLISNFKLSEICYVHNGTGITKFV